MLLELTRAANNLDEAKLESELADRSLQQAEENRRVSKTNMKWDWKPFPTIWKDKLYGNRHTKRK